MIEKKAIRGKKMVSATFRFKPEQKARSVDLVGDFNEWSPGKNPMKARKDGTWSVTLRLPRRHTYQFRYLLDGNVWVTGEENQTPNEYGSTNALIET